MDRLENTHLREKNHCTDGLQFNCTAGLQFNCTAGLQFNFTAGLQFNCYAGLQFNCIRPKNKICSHLYVVKHLNPNQSNWRPSVQ